MPATGRGGRFEVRIVIVAPGAVRAYDATEWRDALVVVARGEIELVASSGRVERFGQGASLWLDGLELRALRNRRTTPAALLSITRDEFPSPGRSHEHTPTARS